VLAATTLLCRPVRDSPSIQAAELGVELRVDADDEALHLLQVVPVVTIVRVEDLEDGPRSIEECLKLTQGERSN
jgi:hypothetical protein